jgi:hypothetical protein
MFQIILMNIRVMRKARETKSRNIIYQSQKTSSIKRLWYNHEYSWRL